MKRSNGQKRAGSPFRPVRPSARTLRLALVSLCLLICAAGIILVPARLLGVSAAAVSRAAVNGSPDSADAKALSDERFAKLASQTHLFGASSLFVSLPSTAQNVKASDDGLWKKISESSIARPAERTMIPRAYQTVRLDKDAMTQLLARAPMEFTEAARNNPVTMSLPLPDGTFSKFRIEESPIMEPALAAQFPQIKTYRGQGIDDPTATTRFDVTPEGFHAMIISVDGTIYIDPYAKGDTVNYITFYKRDAPNDAKNFECFFSEVNPQVIEETVPSVVDVTSGPTLRTYRLALAATAEYTTIFRQTGDTDAQAKDRALAAMVVTMNRVDGVYEREVGVHFVMVANELSIIYTNASTDPYTNNNGSTMLGQNQTNLDSVIGTANYDIGHVFSTGGGGVANLSVICTSSKARGVTGLSNPVGDGFAIDYVAHEMGHQFGANHTFNGTTSNCGGGNRAASAAYEPGSGSTIMPYAGICGAQDLQLHSDDYFHIKSLQEIISFITTGSGNNCPVQSATGNTAPAIEAGPNFNIPISTPFTLTAVGSDPNGDALTYAWEEFDLGAASPPDTDSGGTARPILRSYLPMTSPSRTFPKLQYILNNANVPPTSYDCGRGATNLCLTGEILPAITRTMTFQVTARDNRSNGGGINSDSMQVSVSATSGPFVVTAPNTAVSWAAGSTQTVTWNVANTTAAPVSCANVKISLSTDGGNSFPTVLLASTPNDGTENVTVPNAPTTTARIKVEAVGNIFFDISGANFTITGTQIPAYHAPYDFDGDNKSDVSTWRGSDGFWNIIQSSAPGTQRSFYWGSDTIGDKMVPGDYDGDSKTDFAVYRSTTGVWYISKNAGGDIVIPWGSSSANDKPVPADYDGDGKTDIAVWRPAEGTEQGIWYVLKSSDNYSQATYIRQPWGASTDKPVPADYDFDGKADFAIVRTDSPSVGSATWWILFSSGGYTGAQWGASTDLFVVGDYDGDRKADLAVFRPSDGTWYVAKSSGGFISTQFGLAGDVPVAADYDGDGKTDIAVFRPGDNYWYILASTAGFIAQPFGGSGETPVPSAYTP